MKELEGALCLSGIRDQPLRVLQAAGADKRLPVRGVAAAEQQYLHRHAGILLDAKQAGGDHLGLVDDQGIAGVEVVDDIVEVLMFDLPAVPVVNQQAAVVPGFHGGLGDQLFGKVIVEVGSFHGVQISILICASAVAGMFFFICAQAAGVQTRPRGVRIRKPSCIR